jgi:hypothetical protein
VFEDFEVTHAFPTIGPRTMLLNARKLYRPGNNSERILLAIEDITERKRIEQARLEHARVADFGADVALALVQSDTVTAMLHTCADAMVRHLEAAFAHIWTLNEAEQVLEIRASAGLYTHLDGAHSRVPMGAFEIGRIAQERMPYLTNAVIGDPLVPNQT